MYGYFNCEKQNPILFFASHPGSKNIINTLMEHSTSYGCNVKLHKIHFHILGKEAFRIYIPLLILPLLPSLELENVLTRLEFIYEGNYLSLRWNLYVRGSHP